MLPRLTLWYIGEWDISYHERLLVQVPFISHATGTLVGVGTRHVCRSRTEVCCPTQRCSCLLRIKSDQGTASVIHIMQSLRSPCHRWHTLGSRARSC
jgi:hypothetical protein